jgi:hypothetical protein
MDQLSDRPRVEPNRVGIVDRLAERREQEDQCDDTERRYMVAGVAPNFEHVSQRYSPMNSVTTWTITIGGVCEKPLGWFL